MDNGRSDILAREDYRDTLKCIRCGACLNVCPIFRGMGGHAYGSVYPGPIGALLSPLFNGLAEYKNLPQASTLCGACGEACPVKIDIPKHLVQLRRDIVDQHLNGKLERFVYRRWARGLLSERMYRFISALQRFELRRRSDENGWVSNLPKIAAGWTKVRDMPAPAETSFRELWKDRS